MIGSQAWCTSAIGLIHSPVKKGQGKEPHRQTSPAQEYRARFSQSLTIKRGIHCGHELRVAARKKQVGSSRNKETDLQGHDVHKG